MRKIVSVILIFVFTVLCVCQVNATEISFPDVPEEHWAYEYVTDMAKRGIINGMPDGRFLPDDIVTREQFAKMFVLAIGIEMVPTDNYFVDAEGRWSIDYVRAAYKYLGGSAYPNNPKRILFNPQSSTLRFEAARALSIYFGYDETEDYSALYTMFDDFEGTDPHFHGYVYQAVKHGLMQGNNFKFNPFGSLTRAEAATIIYRALKRVEEQEVTLTPTPTPVPTPTPMVDKYGRPLVVGGELLDYIEITDEIRKHNLVIDGSFEEGIYKGYRGAGIDWRGWAFNSEENNTGIMKIVTEEKLHGNNSLYWRDSGEVYQYIHLKTGVDYILIFHAKGVDTASAYFTMYDRYSLRMNCSNEWQQRAMKFRLDSEKEEVLIQLSLGKRYETYFDDIIIVESKYIR